MIYDIIYKEYDQMFYMKGYKPETFISSHLENIAKELKTNDLDYCLSESHMLAVLESKGIIVNLLEEDGSRMDW